MNPGAYRCGNCHEPRSAHLADGTCCFDSTKFRPMTPDEASVWLSEHYAGVLRKYAGTPLSNIADTISSPRKKW